MIIFGRVSVKLVVGSIGLDGTSLVPLDRDTARIR
jgi:hypothetical protein